MSELRSEFDRYLQKVFPKLWNSLQDGTLSSNERWLITIAEGAFRAGYERGFKDASPI